MNKMLRTLLELERLRGEKYGSAGCSVYSVALFSCDLAHPEGSSGGLVQTAFSVTFRISYLL
jgi:hypothetical protein